MDAVRRQYSHCAGVAFDGGGQTVYFTDELTATNGTGAIAHSDFVAGLESMAMQRVKEFSH